MSNSRSQSPKNKLKTENINNNKDNKDNNENGNIKEDLKLQLQTISSRLAEIQLEKRKLSPLYRPSKTSPKRSKKSTKREYHHPKLEFVMAEAAYSPYLTPPTASYGQKTLHYPEKMKEIRFQGRDPIPEEGFPVDVEFARRRFIKDIIKFKPRFEFHEEKTNLPLQYLQPPPDLYIPDVHAKPRRESMVFPNLYQPLKGHRGKIPAHLRSYLDFDPTRPETAPAKKLTNEEAKELIHELNEARSPSPLRRLGSGSYQAHGARGGPNKYREDMKYRKAVKEFVRMLSNASGHGELSPNGGTHDEFDYDNNGAEDDDHDDMTDYFKEESNEDDSPSSSSPSLLSPSLPNIESTKKDQLRKEEVVIEEEESKIEELSQSPPPPFPEFINATLRIKKIIIKNLQSKLVFGSKDVYITIKSGKIYSCQTNELFNPPNPVIWEFPTGDYRMTIPVTPSSITKLKLKVTVYNKSKVKQRADIIYGTHTINISQQLRYSGFNNEVILDFEIKTSDGIKGGKMTLYLELLDGIFENNEPDQESKIEPDIIIKKEKKNNKDKKDNKSNKDNKKDNIKVKGKSEKISSDSRSISPLDRNNDNMNEIKSNNSITSKNSNKDQEFDQDKDYYNSFLNDSDEKMNDNNSDNNDKDFKEENIIKSSEASLTDENHVPISIDNFFDALSSDDEATNNEICYYNEGSQVLPMKTTELNEENDNNEYDDDKLYDGFDDDDDHDNNIENNNNDNNNNNGNEFQDKNDNQNEMKIQNESKDEKDNDQYDENLPESKINDQPVFRIGRQLTLKESNENWEHDAYDGYEDFENEEKSSEVKQVNYDVSLNEEEIKKEEKEEKEAEKEDNYDDNEYTGDDYDYDDDENNNNNKNKNEEKNIFDEKKDNENNKDEDSYYDDEKYDNESINKLQDESKVIDENNDYGGDDFDEESQTKNSIVSLNDNNNNDNNNNNNNEKENISSRKNSNSKTDNPNEENNYEEDNEYDNKSQITSHSKNNNDNSNNNDEYTGDDFENESLTKQSLIEKTSLDEYGDEFDNESVEKDQNSLKNQSLVQGENEGSVAYGTDEFENESETKLENQNEGDDYGEEFESESVVKIDQTEEEEQKELKEQEEEHEASGYYDLSVDNGIGNVTGNDISNSNGLFEESNLHGTNLVLPGEEGNNEKDNNNDNNNNDYDDDDYYNDEDE